jgi:hypothetical protein
MKKIIAHLVFVFMIIILLSADLDLRAEAPDPPGGHGWKGNHGSGGTAPLDGGSLFLFLAGLGYGAFKVIRANLRKKGDE